MRNKHFYEVFILFCSLIILAGCTTAKPNSDISEASSGIPISTPLSMPDIPRAIGEAAAKTYVPVCDGTELPSAEAVTDWNQVVNDQIKLVITYPTDWVAAEVTNATNAEPIRWQGLPEYIISDTDVINNGRSAAKLYSADSVYLNIGLSYTDKPANESLLDYVARQRSDSLLSSTRYELTMDGQDMVVSWNGYNWLTYYIANGSNVYTVTIPNLMSDQNLGKICGIISKLEFTQTETIELPSGAINLQIPADIDTSTWQTYTDSKTGAQIKYPNNWYLTIEADDGYVGFNRFRIRSYDRTEQDQIDQAESGKGEIAVPVGHSELLVYLFGNDKSGSETIMDYMNRKVGPEWNDKRRVVSYGAREVAVDESYGVSYLVNSGVNVFGISANLNNSRKHFATIQHIVAGLELPNDTIDLGDRELLGAQWSETNAPQVLFFNTVDYQLLLEYRVLFPENTIEPIIN